jgi:hypothetical protein
MAKPSSATLRSLAAEASGLHASVSWCLRATELALLGIAAVFFALHFVHLRADFPNYSFWRDWAKFTDEGWYGDAAIRHYQLGHWNLPGDFNPAAALPVWPMLEFVLFRFTGVSLVAGRALTVAIFGMSLGCSYVLLRRWTDASDRSEADVSLAPAAVVALLAVSPLCFVFTRIAILEPLLILETLFALLVATWAGRAAQLQIGAPRTPAKSRTVLWSVVLGLMLPLMILTKTTGLFLFPAIFWMLWAATGYRVGAFLRIAIPAAALGAALWGAYFGLLVHAHYLLDYQYLFSANAYTGFKWSGAGDLLLNTVIDGIWIGRTLFGLALLAMIGAVILLLVKGVRSSPLPITMLLWIVGYGAFLAYHANLQPRYYLVLAVPMTALTVLVFAPVLASAARSLQGQTPAAMGTPPARAADRWLLRAFAAVVGFALLFAAVNGARQTAGFVLHPSYTWVDAAEQLRQAVEQEAAHGHALPGGGQTGPGHSRMVLSISGSDLSLITGLPSICDDFGTMTLVDRIATYKPGWFATWNEVEDDKMEALAPSYRLERVLTVPAFDDPDRNLLILYRLDPLASPGPAHGHGHQKTIYVPKSLRDKIGQQPSVEQLRH